MEHAKLEIRELVDRYSLGVTLRDQTIIASVFAQDGVWKVAAPFNVNVVGADQIAGAICGSLASMDVIVQMVHSVVIEVNGDAATSRAVMQEIGRAADRTSGMAMLGIYDDRVKRIDGRWFFKERSFKPLFLDSRAPEGAAFSLV